MNTFRSVLVPALFVLLVAAPRVRAQTADEIIAKHIGALGGREKLLSIQSVYQEGVAVMQNGTEIDTKTWRVQGKLYRQEISFGMGNIVLIVTPTQGWSSNPRNGGAFTAMTDEMLKGQQMQLDCAGALVDYVAKGSKVELAGKDTVAGKECYKLKLTPAAGPEITYAIDESTWYIMRESYKGGGMPGRGGGNGGGNGGAGAGGGRPGGNGEIKLEFADYQKTPDGYVFPFTIIAGGFGARNSVEKLEVNKPVDIATLSKPK